MSPSKILRIENLHASIEDVSILNGVNLSINSGEIHAIMGPNGSGKSTLAKVIAGHPLYKIDQGTIKFNNEEITTWAPEMRTHKGIFLAFQYPVEIPGVNNLDFLRIAYNAKQVVQGLPELDPLTFFNLVNRIAQEINLSTDFLTRDVNQGFSGGEKKKNEILQMTLLKSKLSILDEADSGLDVDALRNIATHVKKFLNPTKILILITHYQRILEYIVPDFIHIMHQGKIILTGTSELAGEIEKSGYRSFMDL
uniref:Probable ATP-dependent transporter ycf16 n=1 Tax=Neogoniolithon spectabile TaxID=231755 RepID=A0A3G3MGX0_9FLOR|nr:iron-sulfur cluster formation ABC transporter ATP-binding subunit [Neogoniolithon spectabile]AYR06084.1 iron-sulfur cluster formation ABC transporter ATP-binding subunit [Neogoniolithon spectabile]